MTSTDTREAERLALGEDIARGIEEAKTMARAAEIEDVLEPIVRVVGITGDVTLPEDLSANYGDTVTLIVTARVTEVRTRAGYVPDAPTRKRWDLTIETLDIVDGTAVESGPPEHEAVAAVIVAAHEARLQAALSPASRRDTRPPRTRPWLLPLVLAGAYVALCVAPFLLFSR